jgi:hypothetical protein
VEDRAGGVFVAQFDVGLLIDVFAEIGFKTA